MEIFKQQIKEDLELLKEKLAWDSNINKDEYTFNYWVLSNIYNLDEEECNTNITEYNDKGIDCFVHYEEDKELYIIQNKYYNDNTHLSSKEVSDFLTRPLSKLNEGKYKRSSELQKIYTKIRKEKDYKIFLHFYVTNNKISDDIKSIIKDFKNKDIFAGIFSLDDIKEKYFGKSFMENPYLKTTLDVKYRANTLAIRPQNYSLPNMSEAYYVMAQITDVYSLWKDAENKKYPLFEENIREYLGGTSGINKGIIATLKNKNERGNFFYYNNGITMICDKAKADSKKVEIINPQVVNGCQTVNSIAEVLRNDDSIETNFKDVFVMVKILVLEKKDTDFYRDIVKYTNSQNSINEKVFGATLQPFFTIKGNLKKFGVLLTVKQSDKFQLKKFYKDKKELGKILNIANGYSNTKFYEFKNVNDLQLPLETLIQIIGAYIKDAFFSYTKKSYLLKPTNKEYYQEFSIKIGEILTSESMLKLILLYKKAEQDKKNSKNKRNPVPYYLLNFLGYHLRENNIDQQTFLKEIDINELAFIYDKFKVLSDKYITSLNKKHQLEYNHIIKQKIDLKIMDVVLKNHLESLEEYNNNEYNKLSRIFERISQVSQLV